MKTESRQMAVINNPSISADEPEEEDYVNAAVCVVVKDSATPRILQKESKKMTRPIIQSLTPVAVCWVILVMTMGLRIHFMKGLADERQTLSVNYSELTGKIQLLTAENQKLREENHRLKAESQTLTAENQKLREENQWLKAENQTLTAENQKLREENQRLRAESQTLTAETTRVNRWWNGYVEGSTTPLPWSRMTTDNSYLTSHFYGRKKRQTGPCEPGWLHFRSSCYVSSSHDGLDLKTWEGARDDCRGRGADLVVIGSPAEQDFLYSSWVGSGASGYWIGLRFEGDGWKWVSGGDNFRLRAPADPRRCVISVREASGWKAESCDVKHEWICQKVAVTG